MNKNIVWQTSSFKNEKRKKPRVKLEIEGIMKINKTESKILILNVGVGGCYFQSFSIFNIGEEIEISFEIEKKILMVKGNISRINGKNYTMKYDNPSSEFLSYIEKYILNFYGVMK
jgi:hypothetical protein